MQSIYTRTHTHVPVVVATNISYFSCRRTTTTIAVATTIPDDNSNDPINLHLHTHTHTHSHSYGVNSTTAVLIISNEFTAPNAGTPPMYDFQLFGCNDGKLFNRCCSTTATAIMIVQLHLYRTGTGTVTECGGRLVYGFVVMLFKCLLLLIPKDSFQLQLFQRYCNDRRVFVAQ